MRSRSALALLLWLAVATPSTAQPRSDADKLYLDGVKLLKKGDVPGAVERFQLALELERSAPLLFNLGQALAKLGRPTEAKKILEEARELAQKKGPESIVKLSTDALAELEAKLPRVTVVLPAGAKGARVELDGKPFDVTRADTVVEPGRHELSVTAPGYEPHRESFKLEDGERRRLELDLEQVEKAKGGPSTGTEKKGPSLLGPLILGGVGVASLAGATWFFLEVKSIDDERRGLWGTSGCPGPSCPNGEPARAAELREDAEGKALVGNVLLGVGTAALVAGGAWYFLSKKPREPAAARSLHLVPAPGGVSVGGTL